MRLIRSSLINFRPFSSNIHFWKCYFFLSSASCNFHKLSHTGRLFCQFLYLVRKFALLEQGCFLKNFLPYSIPPSPLLSSPIQVDILKPGSRYTSVHLLNQNWISAIWVSLRLGAKNNWLRCWWWWWWGCWRSSKDNFFSFRLWSRLAYFLAVFSISLSVTKPSLHFFRIHIHSDAHTHTHTSLKWTTICA